jgi:CRP/FNR family transcriptional regulator, dissimilatory nitrate respiration regulator
MTASNGRLVEGVIANLPMFRQAGREHLAELARRARTQHVRRGALVVRRGERLQGLLAIGYGLVKLSLRGESGDEKVLRLVGPGETFGEAVLFLERPVPVDAVALADTLLVLVPTAPLMSLIERDPRFTRALLAAMSQRMHALVADFEATTMRGAMERVVSYLESLAEPGGASATVRLPATKTVVAARLGVTKETLSRLLRELVQRDLVVVNRREITLLDRTRLTEVMRANPLRRAMSPPAQLTDTRP